jgi:Raf kinase inhibitor-like YbhB/YbcL family protein
MARSATFARSIVLITLSGCMLGCAGGTPIPNPPGSGTVARTFTLQSSAFFEGAPIPAQFTAFGLNISPPLGWVNAPAGTQSYVLTMTDDNVVNFTQWVIYNIPATTTLLPQDLPTTTQLLTPVTALQGPNSAGGTGYTGPNPPAGSTHRYTLTLRALDNVLTLAPGTDIQTVLAASLTHVLQQTQLTTTFTAPS